MSASLIYSLILNWNRPDDTIACISSLLAVNTPNTRILVVDNGSTDDSLSAIQTEFPQVEVIESDRNLGFAGGMNLGLRQALKAGADYVFLLNNDTVVDPAIFDQLLKYASPDVGMLAPAIFYFDHPTSIWSTGGGFDSLLLEMKGNHGRDEPLPQRSIEREFLSACALLIPRYVFEDVGQFDERFFMYYEDLDFCLRVRQAKYRLLLVPEAQIWHRVSRSSGGAESKMERYHMAISSGLYFRKHMQLWQAFFIIPYRLLSAVRWTVRLGWRRRWPALKAYWHGLGIGWFGLKKDVA